MGLEVPHDAVAGLELFGENVCMELPQEARQLFLCHELPSLGESANIPSPPRLRVGRHHQRGFWRLVLQSDYYAEGCWAFLAADHFELFVAFALDSERPDKPLQLLFKLHVLSAPGIILNHSTQLECGEQHTLRAGDILSVGALHFRFTPYSLQGCESNNNVRPLPEDEVAQDDTPNDHLYGAVQTEYGVDLQPMPPRTAGVLMVPVMLEAEEGYL